LYCILLNRNQQIALPDQLPVGEMQLVQEAHDARDELDLVDGRGIAGDLKIVADCLDLRLHDRDRWRCLSGELRLRCGGRRWRRRLWWRRRGWRRS
jgi:hypothetical protein